LPRPTPGTLSLVGGGGVFDFLSELGATSEVVGAFTEATGVVAAASAVEVP
jgi:hypothetical protein